MTITESEAVVTAAPTTDSPRTESVARTSQLARVIRRAEGRLAETAGRFSLPLLRAALGVVFIWFGALKVAGTTPVADLVAGTVPWLDRTWFIPALGAAEIIMGIALLVGRLMPFVCAVLAAHLCGTFLVLVMEPELAFQNGNPLLLTTIGEFVVKNLVLISAALVLASKLGASGSRPDHGREVGAGR